MDLKPGDLSFIPCSGAAMDRLIARMENDFDETGGDMGLQVIHVGLIGANGDTIIEMTSPEMREIPLTQETRTKVFMRPQCADDIKRAVIAHELKRLGERYEVWEYWTSKYSNVAPNHFCSAVQFEEFKLAGFTLRLPKRRPGDLMVSPDELFMSPDLVRV